ncbi:MULTISPECIES: hypothetical protein [Streptomyces]|nr:MULTISPECIES: hypothetical protein [Streptomyces]
MERRQVLADMLADPWLAEPVWSTIDLSETLHRCEVLEGTGVAQAIGFMC